MEPLDPLTCDRCYDTLVDVELLISEHNSEFFWLGYCSACDNYTARDAEPQPAAADVSWPPGGWPTLIAWGIGGAFLGLFSGCGPLP